MLQHVIEFPSFLKITADDDCSYGIRRCFLLGRKVVTNLDSKLKTRGITLPTKVHIVKAMFFPVVLYLDHKEGWVPNNWCFQIVFLQKTLETPLGSQSVLKEINPEYSLYFGHLMRRADSLKKTLVLGKIEDKRRRGQQRTRWLDGITSLMTWVWANFARWWRTGRPGMLQSIGSQGVRCGLTIEQQQQQQIFHYMYLKERESVSLSVMSDSLRSHRL